MSEPGRIEIAAFSLTTFIAAGFELGRKSVLPAQLIGGAGPAAWQHGGNLFRHGDGGSAGPAPCPEAGRRAETLRE